ncbi:bifunctional DNA primase/polymerase [Mycobacterium sp. B14F4]|uniref:bifunctional DNA primase/polymerase n=1 Tax=Mycobacterium sp. B14F4 TaxID=3153565 RepID=UPI00325DA4C4
MTGRGRGTKGSTGMSLPLSHDHRYLADWSCLPNGLWRARWEVEPPWLRGLLSVPLFGGHGDTFDGGLVELPDVTGMSNAEAAEAYAKAGARIVPVKAGTKNPGSYLGQGWPQQATSDLEAVRSWWRRWPSAGIAMHVGASRLLVIDVDRPENVPDELWPLLHSAVFRPTMADPGSRRGHYFFRLMEGQQFGCSLGALKPPQGESWGDVKCYGGAVVLAPTVHPKADDGHEYRSCPAAVVPLLPVEIAQRLVAVADTGDYRSLTPRELARRAERFLDAYAAEEEPRALKSILAAFDPTPDGRHASMYEALCWAMREAKAGRFGAQHAIGELRAVWQDAIGGEYRNGDPDEFDRMVRDAVGVADEESVEELRDRAHRADIRRELQRLRVRESARTLFADEKARARLGEHADRLLDGLAFLTDSSAAEPLWGRGGQVLWAPGEGLMICGPQGVGKSTVAQEIVLARMGLRASELLGFPVGTDERPVLYLAMDRPPQIRRSLARMVDVTDADVAARLRQRLVVWTGPPPFDAAEAPEVFADWVAQHGRDPGLVIVDSLKDLASGLATDDGGAGFNAAMQRVLANGTEFVSLHHQRKANADNKKPNKLSDVYGSTWLTSGQGSVLLLWGEPGASKVELSHLKQPQEVVGPLIVDHAHGSGESVASDPIERLIELARLAGVEGFIESEAVAALHDIDRDHEDYDKCRKKVGRKLARLVDEGVLLYEKGSRGGSGGGGTPSRWRYAADAGDAHE